ncbi:MAG: hypothetical protein MMC23_010160, partial [Stictis urceolatum]|nr:hypothetical protein [Stictis urceolata]
GRRRIERFSGYSECFVPQEWCEGWKKKKEGGWAKEAGRKCQYRDTVLEGLAVWLVEGKSEEGFVERMRKEGLGAESYEDIARYLGKRVEWGGLEANRLVMEYGKMGRE